MLCMQISIYSKAIQRALSKILHVTQDQLAKLMMVAKRPAHNDFQTHEGHTLEAKLGSEFRCSHQVKSACEKSY